MSLLTRIFVTLALVAVIINCIEAASLTQGKRVVGDILACYENINEPAKPGQVVTATRTCKDLYYGDYISYIDVEDVGGFGNGAQANIVAGGVNQRYVSIYMRSGVGQPLDYGISIFVKKAV